ncbi:preprotein translocase subunit YajC [Caulobacter henricii]|uniref:Sec translocon accessory complex subunit YajC n=2 Tax=Caulobacter henricii TaxID=69395 RepID=A0A0P0P0U9_9CAUL|nr:preprotein translocase subunit YajC [Caulobacter henricii]
MGVPTAEILGDVMSGGLSAQLMQIAPILLMVVLFYFMLIRPQQKRAKEHQLMLSNLKRGDNVVLSSGVLGKIVRVEDKEVGLEIAQGVTVKVVKGMITEVRAKGEPAPANDPKS